MTASSRTALITGAAHGIGLAIANRLAHDGHPVIMLDRSPEVMQAAHALSGRGLKAIGLCVAVSDQDGVRKLPKTLEDWWSTLAIVVTNAGISPKHEGRKYRSEERRVA